MAEVLSLPIQSESNSYFSSSPLQRSSPTQSFIINSPPPSAPYSRSSSKSPHLYHEYPQQPLDDSSVSSSPNSPSVGGHVPHPSPRTRSPPKHYLNSDTKADADEEDQILFPTYDDFAQHIEDLEPPSSDKSDNSYEVSTGSSSINTTEDVSRLGSPELKKTSEDDTAVHPAPVEHVDYLSHNWKEPELWASWRHIVSKRKSYSNSERLENASWRTWTMSKNRLRTVRPETLNWQKESDVTWLYGPLQTSSHASELPSSAPPDSRLSKSNSFLNKKPILKKRSMSEMMLQRSLSASSLLKQATASVQAQQKTGDRPRISRASSDFVSSRYSISDPETQAESSSTDSSCSQTPGNNERKHIHFNDRVEQCIALDGKDGDDDEGNDVDEALYGVDDESSDDEGVIMMKGSSRSRSNSNRGTPRSTPRASFSAESKTIAMLPATTLNYSEDRLNERQQKTSTFGGLWGSSKLSPSSSEETLRPSRAYENFLLVDDDEDADMAWEPPRAFDRRAEGFTGSSSTGGDGDDSATSAGLRRTPSGMFMPYEEDEDDIVAEGLFGKVVNAVNTAKDIGHVIWNVGWKA